ncbi:MAG: formate C-acetyltransferase [Caloramator sp.]|nr:formate C-acetyltransferase [Caloramator sp.]
MFEKEWRNFKEGLWQSKVDVRDFIQKNFTPYFGDESFLESASENTLKLWEKCKTLLSEELQKGGVLDIDTERVSGITSYKAGYIDKELEIIFGLQTDEPLKRTVNPYGGIRMAKQAAEAYGYKLSSKIEDVFTKYRKTHNQGVFDVYTDDIKKARKNGIITGLPDAYGRGRIIGDYRRVALYGVDFLIEKKKEDYNKINKINDETIKLREEIAEQIRALCELKDMAKDYGFDISKPAKNAKEAVQWLYFAYLSAIKEQNGAAISLGRASTFLDIYIERDLKEGSLDEKTAQELIDQFIIKLRLARELRTPEYNELFAGDPLWITESIGGVSEDKRPLVTKNSFRYLQSLINLGPAPEPNLTVLWSKYLLENFKRFCSKISIETSSIQFENDDLMRPYHGDDYGIACCVSAMTLGKQMQFFGARCNIAKTLLLALNEGRDEMSGTLIVPDIEPITDEILDYEKVMKNFNKVLDWVTKVYVDAMNIIHYMHDKYAYERIMMALHDTNVERIMAFGIAGLSVAADSLSAIKYAKVKPIRDERGITCDFKIEGEFPCYGNDDDRADELAFYITKLFYDKIKRFKLYRNAHPTLSILTITSNVVYGKKTGATPDGRDAKIPFAPGANPMAGRDKKGVLAFLNSVSKISYDTCRDGISCTLNLVPEGLGKEYNDRINNLKAVLDGYFYNKGHHLNINVISRETLIDAMENPLKYPQLTIRVSGYAVNFNRLTDEQKKEVIGRTFHNNM